MTFFSENLITHRWFLQIIATFCHLDLFFVFLNQFSFGKNKKGLCPTVLIRLLVGAYSRARSHYCSTRELLPAVFPPWAGTSLIMQPGRPNLRRADHIDAELSVDAWSP